MVVKLALAVLFLVAPSGQCAQAFDICSRAWAESFPRVGAGSVDEKVLEELRADLRILRTILREIARHGRDDPQLWPAAVEIFRRTSWQRLGFFPGQQNHSDFAKMFGVKTVADYLNKRASRPILHLLDEVFTDLGIKVNIGANTVELILDLRAEEVSVFNFLALPTAQVVAAFRHDRSLAEEVSFLIAEPLLALAYREREIFKLRYFLGFSLDYMAAEIFKCSPDLVANDLIAAETKIREHLQQRPLTARFPEFQDTSPLAMLQLWVTKKSPK